MDQGSVQFLGFTTKLLYQVNCMWAQRLTTASSAWNEMIVTHDKKKQQPKTWAGQRVVNYMLPDLLKHLQGSSKANFWPLYRSSDKTQNNDVTSRSLYHP